MGEVSEIKPSHHHNTVVTEPTRSTASYSKKYYIGNFNMDISFLSWIFVCKSIFNGYIAVRKKAVIIRYKEKSYTFLLNFYARPYHTIYHTIPYTIII